MNPSGLLTEDHLLADGAAGVAAVDVVGTDVMPAATCAAAGTDTGDGSFGEATLLRLLSWMLYRWSDRPRAVALPAVLSTSTVQSELAGWSAV